MKYVLPCWYALLVGVSVSCTTRVQMNETALVKPIFYFVVIAFLTFLPIVIYRLCTLEVPDAQYRQIFKNYAYSKTKNQQEAEILLDRIVKRKKSIMKRIDILKEEISKERQKQINKTNYIEQTKNHKVHK